MSLINSLHTSIAALFSIFFAASTLFIDIECKSHNLSGFSQGLGIHRQIGNNARTSLSGYNYETLYFKQTLDHFNFANNGTFSQRYLFSNEYWNSSGPIFFYTGNEGDIAWFCNNTGFVWDIAPEFKAMIVFAEHRYYGESLPFGNESFSDAKHAGYLTSEQALADFATLIKYLKSSIPGADKSPVIAFGGSYGGMMATWFRMKYPNIVDGALAASAPIWQFPGLTPCNSSFNIITQDFAKAGTECAETIHESWDAINRMKNQESGRQWLTKTFQLCAPLKTQTDVDDLSSWLSNTWFNLAMVDYPYPASFLEPLPAWPVKKTCSYMTNSSLPDKQLIDSVASSLQVYYNTTGKTQCFNTSQDAVSSLGELGWSYQSCTEMVMPSCSDGVHDMFPPHKWDFDELVEECQNTKGVTPRPDWIVTHYGGKDIKASSNIIFSNGDLDPWSGGGVLHSLSETLVAIVIKDGAHHLDLRAKDKADPQTVIDARNQEKQIINKWIQQARDCEMIDVVIQYMQQET